MVQTDLNLSQTTQPHLFTRGGEFRCPPEMGNVVIWVSVAPKACGLRPKIPMRGGGTFKRLCLGEVIEFAPFKGGDCGTPVSFFVLFTSEVGCANGPLPHNPTQSRQLIPDWHHQTHERATFLPVSWICQMFVKMTGRWLLIQAANILNISLRYPLALRLLSISGKSKWA